MNTSVEATPVHWVSRHMSYGISGIKKGVHGAAGLCTVPAGPKILVNTISSVADALILIPPLSVPIQPLKSWAKDLKNFFNLLKGPQSIDNLVNKPLPSVAVTALNVSGTALFVFSILGYIKKFKWSDLSGLHSTLNKIPKVHVLPYSGLLALSSLSLQTSLLFIAIEKERQLERDKQQEIRELKPEKIEHERLTNALAIAQRVCTITSILLVSTATVTGVGVVIAIPTATGLSLMGSSLDLTSYILKSRNPSSK